MAPIRGSASGQHTEEVLREVLGVGDAQLEDLRTTNVIGTVLLRK